MSDSDQLLPPGLNGLLGGVRISGFEIHLPGRASQWLELDETLNILYGKNGVGKSSILEALNNFARGVAFRNDVPNARIFFKLDGTQSFLDESINTVFDRSPHQNDYWDPDPLISPLPDGGLLLFNPRNPERQNEVWGDLTGETKRPDFQLVRMKLQEHLGASGDQEVDFLPDWDRKVTVSEFLAALIVTRIRDESGPVDSVYSHTWPYWYDSYIRTCITTTLFGFTPRFEDLVDTDATWNCEGIKNSAEILGIVDIAKERFDFLELSKRDIRDLIKILLASRITGVNFEKCPELLNLLKLLVGTLDNCNFCLSPNHHDSGKPWEFAIQIEDEDLAEALFKGFRPGHLHRPYELDWIFWNLKPVTINGRPLARLDLDLPVHKLPFVVADIRKIDKTVDQVKATIRDFKNSRPNNMDLDLSRVRILLQQLSSRTSQLIKQIGVQIDEVRISLSEDPIEWALDRGITIEAFDQHSQNWIRQDLLSEAQQRWLDYSFRLAHLTFYTSPLLILADEPDNGLHTTASRAALESLSTVGGTVVVASHSVAALRLNKGRIIHVQRDADGSTFIESIDHEDGDLLNALKLGVDQSDLLALKRVAVFVEGNHDVLVLRVLLADQKNSIIDKIKFLPTRGEKQLTNSVDSQLLLSYTNLDLVIVADNIRTEFFNGKISDLIAQQTAGVSIADLCRNLQDWRFKTLEKTKRGRINEERTMVDILDRAIRIGALNRIHIMGIEANDILESIPSSYFNLKLDWNELHRLHEQEKDRNLRESKESGSNIKKTGDFKTWISTNYSMKFTESVISDAFLRAFRDGIPVELENLKVLLIALSSTPKVSDPSGLFN